jgi:hypothetical protein
MRWRELAWVGIAVFLFLVPARGTPAVTSEQAACGTFMVKMTGKYHDKHYKLADKCTFKMGNSADPNSEKCDDGFDPTKGDNSDFLIDKFQEKFFEKIKKKCIKKLGIADLLTEPAIPGYGVGCEDKTFLSEQIECLLQLDGEDADVDVCKTPPHKRMNANRATLAPPGLSDFCDPNGP